MPNRPRPSSERSEVYSVTTVRASAAQDRHHREVRYLLTMAFRMVCFGGALVTTGWVRWIAVAVAVLTPWVAVVMANNAGTPSYDRVDPGATRGLGTSTGGGSASPPSPEPAVPSSQGPISGVVHLPREERTASGVPSGRGEEQ